MIAFDILMCGLGAQGACVLCPGFHGQALECWADSLRRPVLYVLKQPRRWDEDSARVTSKAVVRVGALVRSVRP